MACMPFMALIFLLTLTPLVYANTKCEARSATCMFQDGESWNQLAALWANTSGAAKCTVIVAVQDGDLACEKEAAPSVIAWDGAEKKFALTQNNLTVLVDPLRLRGVCKGVDAAVDRAVNTLPAATLRREIPESPWPQLAMALRNSSTEWWKDIDPELGEVVLKSFVKKDGDMTIVMLTGKYGSLELIFIGETPILRAATRRIESGPRVPKNSAIEWRMTFDASAIPEGMLSMDLSDRRRVERLDDLQSPVERKPANAPVGDLKSAKPPKDNSSFIDPAPAPKNKSDPNSPTTIIKP